MPGMRMAVALLMLVGASRAAVHTMTVDVAGAWNLLNDPGFETLGGSEPAEGTSPWFSSGEKDDWQLRVSTNRAYTGRQSVVFANYWERGAVVQNLGVQVNPAKHYRLSVMMRVDEPTDNSSCTNVPALHASIYTGATPQGPYSYRMGFFWNATTRPGGGWEKLEGTINGANLSTHAGEYIQVRIIKANEKATHRIFIDNASVIESGSVVAPETIGRYLVGANVVYTKEVGPDWEDGYKTEVLKRAGMSNLRYPGGHVVSYWDWEWPYHEGYRDFWNASYAPTAAESNALFAANQHRLSLDDYLDECRETGAAPIIGINMLQGYKFNRDQDSIDKAVRLVNYVKNQIDGPRYYYLDNEAGHQPEKNNHVPVDDYLLLIPGYSTAIKAADPLGRIAVNIMGNNRVQDIIRDYGDHVDLIDHHWYYNNITWGQFWLDEWRVDDGDMNGRVGYINQFNGWIDTYDKPHLKIGFLEWNLGPAEGADGSTPGTALYQGLVQADMLMVMMDGNIHMGSIWPLTWNDGADGGGFRDLTDGSATYVSPAFYIHRAFANAAGGTMLGLNEPVTAGVFRSLAVKSADEGFIDLYFLNKSTETVELDIALPVPIVEAVVMNFAQGATVEDVNVGEAQIVGDLRVLPLSVGGTSFTHVRCRLPDHHACYDLFSDNFETSDDMGNIAEAPYPVSRWHHQGTDGWSAEGSDASVDIGEFNGVEGNELRIGWGYDEVVALYSTPVPIHTGQSYTFRGRWEIGSVVDVQRGFIAGVAEFSADDGALVQRLTPDSLVFGKTNAPVTGDAGMFEVTLGAEELAAAGTFPGNRIGVFFHHNNGDDQLYGDSNSLRNDVYYIDNVSLEVSGSISLLDQWMVSNKVANALMDSDGDGVDNQTEYWLGGDPTIDDASTIRPTARFAMEAGANWLEYVYRRRSDYLVRGLDYSVEATTNLVSGLWSSSGVQGAGYGSIDPEIDSVTNRVSAKVHPEQYIRLRVE